MDLLFRLHNFFFTKSWLGLIEIGLKQLEGHVLFILDLGVQLHYSSQKLGNQNKLLFMWVIYRSNPWPSYFSSKVDF